MTSDRALEAALISDEAEACAFTALYAAAPDTLRKQLGLRIEQVAGVTLMLAPGIPDPMFNRAIGFGMRQPATQAGLQAIADTFRQAGCGTWWLHWNPLAQPEGFAAELERSGYSLPRRRSWAKMLRGPQSLPRIATDLGVGRVTPGRAPEVARIVVEAFGMPPFMVDWLMQLDGGPWRMYAVTDGDAIVGGGCLHLEGDMAWLGVAGVAPSHRRRGGQGALMARRIADAAAAGARHIVTETGEPTTAGEANPSFDNMKRCGFVTVASRLNYAAPA
jgi:GNAT superfamily N-acetyltransferase